MCYLVYISTDFEGDLSQHNSALISFEKDFTSADTEIIDLLHYKYRWYVGSKAGCSCTFRHLSSIELGFGEPVYWYEESSDEIEATKIFYDEISSLISQGNKVDCIEIWAGTKKDQIKRLEVDLSSVPRDAFRFFENHHFVFINTERKTDNQL
jgi:hypothetical protein